MVKKLIQYDEWMKEIGRQQPGRKSNWTEERNKFLIDARKCGYFYIQIAETLKCSESVVRRQARKLGVK